MDVIDRSVTRETPRDPLANETAGMIGTGVANPTLASGRTDRAQRPDIWTQAIENDARQPLQAGRRPHMDPRVFATELRSCFVQG